MIQLTSDEKLILEVRKHWLVFALGHLYYLVLAILPLVLLPLFEAALANYPGLLSRWDLADLGGLFYFLWLLALWTGFAVSWTNYYLDAWYVTSERLIDVEQKGIFLRDEAITRLDNIQDVTVETVGILATLFGFGTIKIQTAGESREFVVRYISAAEQVRQTILSLSDSQIDKPQDVKVVS